MSVCLSPLDCVCVCVCVRVCVRVCPCLCICLLLIVCVRAVWAVRYKPCALSPALQALRWADVSARPLPAGAVVLPLSPCVILFEVCVRDARSLPQAVWFGCDVGKHFHGKLGINDMNV